MKHTTTTTTTTTIAIMMLACCGAMATAQEIFPNRVLPDGGRPAVADMNGDGIDDLVTSRGNQVWVYLGLPQGGFGPGSSTAGGLGVASLTFGDMDGDGDLDVVTAASSAGAVGVLLNRGDGTLDERVTYETVANTTGVALGDLDNDGSLDVVATGQDTNEVLVLLGNGDGTLAPPNLRYFVGERPISPIIGDFTGDGNADVVLANSQEPKVTLLFGNGVGAFVARRDYPTTGWPTDLGLIDFDGDGDLDLAACGTFGLGVAIFESRDGSLEEAIYFGVDGVPLSLTAGDMDLDGDEDLMLGEYEESAVVFFRNDGADGFTDAGRWRLGTGSASPAIVDFTRDGVPDIAANAAGITLMRNLAGPGGVEFLGQSVYAAGPTPGWFDTGDANGDGDLDMAIAHGQFGPVTVVLSDGSGGFQDPVVYSPGEFCYTVALEDVDNDGNLDLVAFENNRNRIATRLNDGEGVFGERIFSATFNLAGRLVLADFDGDGNIDAATTDIFLFDPNISVQLGRGDGSFGMPTGYEVGTFQRALAAGDANGDGVVDLISVPGMDAEVHVLLGRGDGTFQPVQRSPMGYGGADLIALGDLNADGLDDIAVGGDDFAAVKLLLSSGDGAYAESSSVTYTELTTDLAISDADGDGNLDLAIGQGRADRVALALGTGDGGLQPTRFYAAGPNVAGVALADMTGDGLPDLVTTRNFDESFGVLANLGAICPADFDGDGELTIFDFLAFQNAFDAGDPAADFDGDGELTIFDFLAFQNAFDAGCD